MDTLLSPLIGWVGRDLVGCVVRVGGGFEEVSCRLGRDGLTSV